MNVCNGPKSTLTGRCEKTLTDSRTSSRKEKRRRSKLKRLLSSTSKKKYLRPMVSTPRDRPPWRRSKLSSASSSYSLSVRISKILERLKSDETK